MCLHVPGIPDLPLLTFNRTTLSRKDHVLVRNSLALNLQHFCGTMVMHTLATAVEFYRSGQHEKQTDKQDIMTRITVSKGGDLGLTFGIDELLDFLLRQAIKTLQQVIDLAIAVQSSGKKT